jgi:outer membrane murein-binding lipoprotein Lpp
MKTLQVLLAAVIATGTFAGCANNDPYQDPPYTLQRNLYNRNQKWDQMMERKYMRNQARDQRYDAWFNAVME